MTDHLTHEEREVLADPSTWADPSADLEDAIVRAIAHAAAAPPAESASPLPTSPTPIASASRRRGVARSRRLVLSAMAVAAAVAIVAVAIVAARRDPSAEFHGQLAATDLAPGASGSVDVVRNDAGFRFELDARGLPPLVGDEYYQAWLKSPAGTLVPIGSFSSSDDRVTLWSGVSPSDYPTLSVTIEGTDNDQASSGRRVLVGEVEPR